MTQNNIFLNEHICIVGNVGTRFYSAHITWSSIAPLQHCWTVSKQTNQYSKNRDFASFIQSILLPFQNLPSTLPTMQLCHWVTSLGAVYQMACSFFWSQEKCYPLRLKGTAHPRRCSLLLCWLDLGSGWGWAKLMSCFDLYLQEWWRCNKANRRNNGDVSRAQSEHVYTIIKISAVWGEKAAM